MSESLRNMGMIYKIVYTEESERDLVNVYSKILDQSNADQ